MVKSVPETARQFRNYMTACALFVVLHSPVSFAGDVTELPGLSRQTMHLTITSTAGGTKTLETLVVRRDAPGPFPLALITHGLPRNKTEISAIRPELYISPAIVFAQHGYAAVVVMRSGYGRSTGPLTEDIGPCEQRTYLKAGKPLARTYCRPYPRCDVRPGLTGPEFCSSAIPWADSPCWLPLAATRLTSWEPYHSLELSGRHGPTTFASPTV